MLLPALTPPKFERAVDAEFTSLKLFEICKYRASAALLLYVSETLNAGFRTKDIGHDTTLTCSEMGDEILSNIVKLS